MKSVSCHCQIRRVGKTRFQCSASACLWILLVVAAVAGKYTGTEVSTRLYTAPDPSAAGGICGKVVNKTAIQVLAIRFDDPGQVYQADISEDGQAFNLKGLPVAKYDLLIVCGDSFHEGLTLTTDPDTLTSRDRELMELIINKSEPFFDTKKVHRCMGTTGREGKARCVLQQVRTRPVTLQSAAVRSDIQIRSIKLALLEDVGEVGWQWVWSREIARTEVGPPDVKGILPHSYNPALSRVRVVDSVKDIGEIYLQ